MKPFRADPPNICIAAVQPLRTDDAKTIVAELAKLAPPFPPELEAELVALGFAHEDTGVRTKAMALVKKHVADAAKFKTAYKSLAGAAQHVLDERVRAFDHPYRLDISKALLFHKLMAASVAFEQDAEVRAAILDVIVDNAKRDDESELSLGSVYWYWKNDSGWATNLDHHELPSELFGELAKRRARHAFDGLSFHGGSLTTLPDQLADARPWLKSLALDWNPFTTLPAVVFELTNLERLSLVGTELVDIPDAIAKLPKLRELDIGNGKKMPAIPASVCALAKLEQLRIGNGSIRKVPDAIAGMKSLRELEMQSTSIAKLPACMTDMPNLKSIKLKWSKVSDAQIAELVAAGVKVDR